MADYHLNTPEVWKAIPDFPGYEISDHGRVRSFWRQSCNGHGKGAKYILDNQVQRVLKQVWAGPSYGLRLAVKLGKYGQKKVHRLVMEAFIGPCPDGMEGCHNDGAPINNHISNLRWDTPKGNQNDRRKHRTDVVGSRNGRAILTEADVHQIRLLYKQGSKYGMFVRLSKQFGVGRDAIIRIINGKSWTHI